MDSRVGEGFSPNVLRVHTLDVWDNLFGFGLLHRRARDEMRTRTEGDKEASDWI